MPTVNFKLICFLKNSTKKYRKSTKGQNVCPGPIKINTIIYSLSEYPTSIPFVLNIRVCTGCTVMGEG